MFTGLVLAVAVLNGALLWLLSLFAVGGDGSAHGIWLVRILGSAWIVACTLVALWLLRRKQNAAAVLTALATWPLGLAVAQVGVVASIGWERIRPSSAELEAACRDASTTFIARPAKPVQSIAYDWEKGGASQHNYFEVGPRGNVDGLRGGIGFAPYPPAIRFTEARCCRFEGAPLNRVKPYIRRPNPGSEYFGVTELTADALVTLGRTVLPAAKPDQAVVRYDVEVSDRRDGAKLASMRYYLDGTGKRGCVAGGVMDERAFVLKAVGAG